MTDSTAHSPSVIELMALYDRTLDLADLICDRHVGATTPAVLFDTGDGMESLTFAALTRRSQHVAGALQLNGVGQGDHVAVLLPRSPALVVALIAVWRVGAIYVPLFTAFGPSAVGYRLDHCSARAVITDADNRSKIPSDLSTDTCVLTVGEPWPGAVDFELAAQSEVPPSASSYEPRDPFLMLYTSGTTGKPKGVPVPVRALASFHSYLVNGIDLRPADVYWNVGDPGWAYGLWYGIIGPLLLGHPVLMRAGRFDAVQTIATLVREKVTNLAGSPSFYRALMAQGVPADLRDRLRLRAASSAGEPLGSAVVAWAIEQLGVEIQDHYGQTEIGMVIGTSRRAGTTGAEPGSMGPSLPGFQAVVLGDDGEPLPAGETGSLAIDVAASPMLWFSGYYQAPDRTAERYPYGSAYFVTGDQARADDRGGFTSGGRADDVINSSGYRIGPYDVEATLLTHPGVLDAAVFGVPDPLRGELVAAAVVPASGYEGTHELAGDLRGFVRATLGKYLYPREVMFVAALPRTESGKVQRALLRAEFIRAQAAGGTFGGLQPDS